MGAVVIMADVAVIMMGGVVTMMDVVVIMMGVLW